MADEKKVFGPKSKERARRSLAAARSLMDMLDTYVAALPFEDEEDASYDQRNAVSVLGAAVSTMIRNATNVVWPSPIDDVEDVIDLMVKCAGKEPDLLPVTGDPTVKTGCFDPR